VAGCCGCGGKRRIEIGGDGVAGAAVVGVVGVGVGVGVGIGVGVGAGIGFGHFHVSIGLSNIGGIGHVSVSLLVHKRSENSACSSSRDS